jgi:hypothetical protein
MMASEYDDTFDHNSERRDETSDEKNSQLIINRYASPGGGASMKAHDTMYCMKRPANGALNGLPLAKKDAYGRIPSRPSSWITVGRSNYSADGRLLRLYLDPGRTGPKADFLKPTATRRCLVPRLGDQCDKCT